MEYDHLKQHRQWSIKLPAKCCRYFHTFSELVTETTHTLMVPLFTSSFVTCIYRERLLLCFERRRRCVQLGLASLALPWPTLYNGPPILICRHLQAICESIRAAILIDKMPTKGAIRRNGGIEQFTAAMSILADFLDVT